MSQESFLKKLHDRSRTFMLPSLQEEITYNKLDVIQASMEGHLPSFFNEKVLSTMKAAASGREATEGLERELTDEDVKELLIKSTSLWKKQVIEPKLSDAEIVLIPSEDRLAWLMEAIYSSQDLTTKGGGVIKAEEVGKFPSKRKSTGNTERSNDSEVL